MEKITTYKSFFSKIYQIIIFLILVSFINYNLGNFVNNLNNFFIVLFYIIFILSFLNQTEEFIKINKKFLIISYIIIISFTSFLLFRLNDVILNLILLSISIFFLYFLSKNNQRIRMELLIYLVTLYSYLIYIIFYKNSYLLWKILNSFSQLYSKLVSTIINKDILLGQSALGINITILFIFYSISYYLLSDRKKYKILLNIIILSILLNGVYLLLYFPVSSILKKIFTRSLITPLNLQFVYIGLLTLPLYIVLKNFKFSFVPIKKVNYIFYFIGLFLITLSIFILNLNPLFKKENSKILFYDESHLNWIKPEPGKYGRENWGMFGQLPIFLKELGFNVKKDNKISEENLVESDILVLINLYKKFSSKEKETIWSFIEKGGSLLCLGDHTGMSQIREPFNELLSPMKIEYNFDCAQYLKGEWKNEFEFFNSPINKRITSIKDTGIGVGASLKIGLDVMPLINAKYGFSDKGNPNNSRLGYLGDRIYSNGEFLGDLVLVAVKNYKKGKVLVFGDTSSFQNISLARNPEFVERVFLYLSKLKNVSFLKTSLTKKRTCLFIIFFLVGGILILMGRVQLREVTIASFILILLFSYSFSEAINRKLNTKILSISNTAIIDDSHLEKSNWEIFPTTGITGLTVNLIRNKYYPLFSKKFKIEGTKTTKLFISISPSRKFKRKEITMIKDYIKQGGKFILCVGWEDKRASNRIIRDFGFEILNIPLGPVDENNNDLKLQFYNAWPLKILNNKKQIKILCNYKFEKWLYPLIVVNEYEKGKFVLIGDSHFLSNINLETINYYYKNNIKFLESLLRK